MTDSATPPASAPDPAGLNRVGAVVVNYGTPDLTRAAVWSLRSHYPALRIAVVENASPDDSAEQLRRLAAEAPPVDLLEPGENLHHGPGLDAGIRHLGTPWALVFDSDCIAYRGGFLEAMLAEAEAHDAYMVGQVHRVSEGGFDLAETSSERAYTYVHPKCALVRTAPYLTLPPFAKHGAPCLANEIAAAERGLGLHPFPVNDYVFHLGEGTVSRYGYGLGARSVLGRLRHLAARLRVGLSR
ncbi:MAG: glycosyltransferase [Bacteroidota bacterium]